MKMRFDKFEKKAQVDTLLGETMAKAVSQIITLQSSDWRKRKFKRVPWSIEFHSTKPKFGLHDFETMDAYMVHLETGTVSASHYCGSGRSTANHAGEQLSEGFTVPEGYALVFLTLIHGGSGNTAWTLDIVSQNLTRQIEASPLALIAK